MEVFDKIKTIRNLLNIPQRAISKELGCDISYISRLENGRQKISPENLKKIKKALGIKHVPLTADEISSFEKELYNWKMLILEGQASEAAKLQPHLARCAELSFDPNLQILYEFSSVSFYLTISDFTSADKTLSSLTDKKSSFTPKQAFQYYLLLGIYELYKRNNIAGICYLLEAEKLSKQANTAGVGLYYNLALGFTAIDYARKAEEYIGKARIIAEETNHKEYEVYFDSQLSLTYIKVGKYEKALSILQDCLRREKMKIGSKSTIGTMYHNIGCVYLRSKDYFNAIENFDIAFNYYEPTSFSYFSNIYFKAYTLYMQENFEDSKKYIDEGLELSQNEELLIVMFTALKCLINFHNDESVLYIERIAIPKLLEAGKHLLVIEYCGKLKQYYTKRKKYVTALKYSEMAFKYYKKITEGDFP